MKDTDFAVFINGPWGCGKTFFIQNFIQSFETETSGFAMVKRIWIRIADCMREKWAQIIRKRDKSNSNEPTSEKTITHNATPPNIKAKIWYVSLNGVATESNLADRLLSAAFPSKIATTWKIILFLLKLVFRRQNDFGVFGPLIFLVKNKDFAPDLIILDDLERSRMSFDVLLGFISSIVELDIKTIVIGCQEKIQPNAEVVKSVVNKPDSENHSGKSLFEITKEKVIGKTLHLHYDLRDIYYNLVGNGIFVNAEESLRAIKGQLLTRLKSEEKINFRSIKHAFRDFDVLVERIIGLDKRYDTADFINAIGEIFIPFSYHKHIASWSYRDFDRPTMDIFRENKGNTIFEQVIGKCGFLGGAYGNHFNQLIFSDALWKELVWDMNIPDESIVAEIERSPFFYKEEDNDFKRIARWYEMNDNDAIALLKDIQQHIVCHNYTNLDEVLEVFCFLGRSLDEGALRDMTEEKLKQNFSEYMDYIFNNYRQVLDGLPKAWHMTLDIIPRSPCKQKEYFINEIKSVVKKADDERRKQQFFCVVGLSNQNAQAFCDMITDNNSLIYPYLSLLDAQAFFASLLQLDNRFRLKIASSLETRWSYCPPEIHDRERAFAVTIHKSSDAWLEQNVGKKGMPSYVAFWHISRVTTQINEQQESRNQTPSKI